MEEEIEIIKDLVAQVCTTPDGKLNSFAIHAYADAIRFLALRDLVKITKGTGRYIVAEWK